MKNLNMLKKIFLCSIFIFLVSCSSGSKLVQKNIIKTGMTKNDLDIVLAYRTFWDQVNVPNAYREYFRKQKKEILAPDKKNKDIYYVFKNVNRPMKCGWILCNSGDGFLDKTFSNYVDASSYILGTSKKPKKTVSIEDNGKISEISTKRRNGTLVSDLGSLIESLKSGKISQEEFDKKKEELLSE